MVFPRIFLHAAFLLLEGFDAAPADAIRRNLHDRAFVEAQENWVIDSLSSQHPMRGLAPMFGLTVERYVESLGCEHLGCRETAAERLAAMGDGAFRPLIWASRHRDPAIARTAAGMLGRYYPCAVCRGSGQMSDGDPCFGCGGAGTVRWLFVSGPAGW